VTKQGFHTIGEVARAAKVSVRALHHYDEIGLVRPSGRSRSGYRLYTGADLERLQQVLFFRELGFRLEDIGPILEDPGFDRKSALLVQRARLAEDAARATALVALIDATLRKMERGEKMGPEEMFEGFDPRKHEDEARERWGGTTEYKESARRTKGYTKDDWAALGAESGAITTALAEAMARGVKPGDDEAMDLAERHRAHIDRWFYPCSSEIHAGLGEMYVSDPRFAIHYDRHAPGLAVFLRDAIRANAARK